ncbi:unnamed protein product [Urochloa humidicola]
MKKTIVLYPGLFVSHFVPMMQLADVLLAEGYAVAVALIDLTLDQDAALSAAVDRAAAANPSLAIHRLPRIQDPPAASDAAGEPLLWYLEVIQRYNDRLLDFLRSLPPRNTVHAVVIDAPSVAALDVTRELGVPAYTFFAANASAVAVFLQLPWFHAAGHPSFKDLGDAPVEFRGVPPMPASYLMRETLQDTDTEIYRATMSAMRRNAEEPDGILVNTFASLEPRAVGALRDPHLLPPAAAGERRTPPVYCIGPLVAGFGDAEGEDKHKHECLAWLDTQPDRSVVFLCFGSTGAATHSAEQLREVAAGMKNSGHRFLWVVRAPLRDGERLFHPRDDADLDALLPAGFMANTEGRGLVVKHWAPQVEVLRHRATGAFVTHCGWNSALEGVTAGVPMLCWPMYAEQKMNKVIMVEEAGVGVEMAGWEQGMVPAEEVEAKVRLVMETEEGERLRARVAAHRDAAVAACKAGGSSRAAFGQFLADAANLRREK